MNTLDSILDDLRSRLPASLRGAYLDAYVQRRRTPMELLLARSLPGVGASASTFDDARSEIYALKMPQWVANRYLSEIEQALAVGEDTREVVERAKAWMATSIPATAEADECHVCSETGKKSCTACGTEIVPYGAHGLACPKCAEQEIDAANTAAIREGWRQGDAAWDEAERSAIEMSRGPTTIADHFERMFGLGGQRPTSELLIPGKTEDLSGFDRRATYWPKTVDRPHFTLVLRASSTSSPKQLLALGRKALAWFARMRGRPASHPGGPENETIVAVEWMTSSVVVTKLDSGLGVIRIPGDEPRLALLADAHGWRSAFTVEQTGRKPASATRAAPTSRVLPRPPLPDPTTRRGVDGYRSEADILADIFNEEGVWQAEPTPLRMAGTTAGVRLSIYSEQRGHTYAVALATLNDNDVDVEWLSPTLTLAQRNEITRRLRTAAMTHGEDSEAPSPLQDLIDSTEKRALELGAKPDRTRRPGDLLEHREPRTGPVDLLALNLRDLQDPTEIADSIKWLKDQRWMDRTASGLITPMDLGIDFDIDERLSEVNSVSSLMEELWTPILDTIGMEGVYTQAMRGRDRILSVATGAVFRDGAPFLLQRLVQQGRPSLRKVMIELVDDSSDDDVTAFIDTKNVMTVGREQGSLGPMVHSSEQRGADFIGQLYEHMDRLRKDLERAPKALSDVRRLLYWTGAMLGAPRCQDETKQRAMESFEAAMELYDKARKLVTAQATTTSDIASIKAPLRKAAVSAAKLATDCGEGQVDIFSVRQPLAPLRQTADVGMATRERYRQQVRAIGLPFDDENVLMSAVDRALMFGHDADAIIARAREALPRLPSPDEMPSRWMSGDHVVGPNGENGTIVRLEDRGEYGWHLNLDRPPGAHWLSAAGFRRVPESSRQEPPPVPPESPETPLHQQDPNSVDVLDRLVAALSEVFIVTPIRSGHGYRVVDLRSSVDFGVYKGLPRNTYLTTVSLRHSGPSEIIGEKAYLVQSTRDAGLSHDQYRAIRQFVAETVERLTDEAQGKVPPEPEAPDDGEVTTKTFAPRMPTKYLRDFFAEKDIPEVHWTIVDSSGVEHMLSNLVVVEGITQATQAQAKGIGNSLRQLDFLNQDVNGYLKHLAKGLVETYANDTRDSGEPGRHRHDLLTDEGQPSAVAEQGDEQTAADSPRAVTWSDLRKGDLVWDPKSDDYDLLLVTRRGATSHWWTTSGIMQKTGGTTIAVDGTAQHSWSYGPADPAHVLILVGRDVKPYSANVRAAWVSAKDAAQQLAEFY